MMRLKRALLRFFDIFSRRHVLLGLIERLRWDTDKLRAAVDELREQHRRLESDVYRIMRQVDVTCEFYERRIDNIHQNVRRLLEGQSLHEEDGSR
jgi:hypothetical protein